MIKKFEAYKDSEKIDTQFIIDAFVDFIDAGANYNHSDYHFKINIVILCNTNKISQNLHIRRNYDKLKYFIDYSKNQLETLEEINTAILRVKDELGLFPKIITHFYGSDIQFSIQYSVKDNETYKRI